MLHASVRVPPPPVSSGRRSTSQEHVDYPSHTFYRTIRCARHTCHTSIECGGLGGQGCGDGHAIMDHGRLGSSWYASAAV